MAGPSKDSIYKAMKRLFRRYVLMCQRRNVYWGLSLEEFHALTSGRCFYCSRPPQQKSRSYTYNGIDRVNNRQGYIAANCVTACKECNFIKGDRLTQDEMKIVGEALAEFRSKKKT